MKKASAWLMMAGYAVCLLQIWLPAYFVTGDGPCHVYNARVIHDLVVNKDADFFNRFYSLAIVPDPNWLSHIVLALLMFLVKGAVAEKILVTGYVVLFVTGFGRILKRLSGDDYIALIPFLFVFNAILVKGFYNFSFSIAILFWVLDVWLRYLEHRKKVTLVYFLLLATLLFFTHPLAFAFGGLTCFTLTISTVIANVLSSKGKVQNILKHLFVLLVCFLPGIILFVRFFSGEQGAGKIHLYAERYRIADLLHNNYMVSYTSKEEVIAKVLAYVISGLFLASMYFRLRRGIKILQYDGIVLACAVAGYIYLEFPDSLLGGGAFSIRAHYILFLLGTCCIAWLLPRGEVKSAIGVAFFCCSLLFMAVRMPAQLAAASGVDDILSAGKFISPSSVVLPLSLSKNGKDEHGDVIADRCWLFAHAADYLGAEKSLIMLDNYEANVGYFPLRWKAKVNPYIYLSKAEGIEGEPPFVDLAGYRQATGVTADYILLWCYTNEALNNVHFRALNDAIRQGYHVVYTSASWRTTLYERNK